MSTRSDRAILVSLVVFFALMYALIGLFRHWQFGSSAFDLAIFDQAIWHASRFESPASTVSGFDNILGDHFSPIVFSLVPLYWLAPRVEWLLLAQALLFAASVVPVFSFARARLTRTPAVLLTAAYGMFWGIQRAAAFDFHEIAFAPLLIAGSVVALDRRQWTLLWVCCLGLILTKEDLILFVATLGLLTIARGHRWHGALLLIASAVAFVAVTQLIIPALSSRGFQHTAAFQDFVRAPWTFPLLLVTPVAKLETVTMWLASFAFLPLGSPLVLLTMPFVLTRLLSSSPTHFGTRFHYSAPLAPVLAMSAADALGRIETSRRGSPRLSTGVASACLICSLILPGNQPFWDLFEMEYYVPSDVQRAARRAVRLVPPGEVVVAQAALVPHLSTRSDIYVLQPGAPDADVVLACTGLNPYPTAGAAQIGALLEERKASGYAVVFDESGCTILRRAAEARMHTAGTSRHRR